MKYTIITGATRGLGAAISAKFLAEGKKILMIGRSEEAFERFISTYADCDTSLIKFIRQDLDLSNAVPNLIQQFLAQEISVDGIIHNYGGTVDSRNIHDDFQQWDLCLWRNVFFAARLNASILDNFKLSNNLNRIIHVSSASARHLLGAQTYATAKSLLNAYVKSSGRQLATRGIVQLALAPGALNTTEGPWSKKSEVQKIDFFDHYQFSRLLGDERTIAELVFALYGPAGNFCHGNIIECDGASV